MLVDSTPLLADPDALRSRFACDGCLFFRGLLDRHTVLRTRADILGVLAELGWTAPNPDPLDGVPGELIRREGDENWWDGYAAINSVVSFHTLAYDEALVGVQRLLFGSDDLLVHPRKICRVTYPKSEYPTPPHQDFPALQGTVDCVSVWVPLGDVPAELGGLRVLHGSAAQGMQEVIVRPGVGGFGVAADDDDPRWITADYQAGDVLMFHVFTVHWAPPNRGERLRLSVDYRYQRASDPVTAGSLYPHQHPRIPGWDELTKDWDSTWPVAWPANIPIVEMQDPRTVATEETSSLLNPA